MQSTNHDIDVRALAGMRADGATHTVLDIREPAEVAICVIDDSLTMPMHQVPGRIDTLPRSHPLVVVCHHGVRSAMVTSFLRDNGFGQAWNLAGGIDAWSRLVEPDMPRY